MVLEFTNLFECIFPIDYNLNQKETLIKKINTFKLDNLININKQKRNKFLFVISEEQNIINFRIDPFFELIDIGNEINEIENYNIDIINNNLHGVYNEINQSNIFINILNNSKLENLLLIKKLNEEINLPEDIINNFLSLEEDNVNLENNNFLDLFNQINNFPNINSFTDYLNEENTDYLNEENTDYLNEEKKLKENLISDYKNTNNKEIVEVHLSRTDFLDSFGFNITINSKNNLVISNIEPNSVADNKMVKGDIINSINNISVNEKTQFEIIKYVLSNLTINLQVYREKINNRSKETLYRFIGEKYIKLSIFKKGYDFTKKKYTRENMTFLNAIFLSDNCIYPKIFEDNLNNTTHYIDTFLKNESIFTMDYFNKYYVDYGEITDLINIYIDFNNLDSNFFNNISKIKSGVYLNPECILWNIYITLLIASDICETNFYSYKNYKKSNIKQLYVPYYKPKQASEFEKQLIKSLIISCDVCNKMCSENLYTKFYGSSLYGDLCNECFIEKKNVFYKRINYLKKKMLLEGKKKIFSKELEKTTLFLKTYKIKKIQKTKYVTLLENINKNILLCKTIKTCKICFEQLEENLCCSKICGHVFHINCIKNTNSIMCPACREHTTFVNLFY